MGDAPTFIPCVKRYALNGSALWVLPKGLPEEVTGTSLGDTGSVAPALESEVLPAAGRPQPTSLCLSELLSFSFMRSELH